MSYVTMSTDKLVESDHQSWHLINELAMKQLLLLKSITYGFEILYVNPPDATLWEIIYPNDGTRTTGLKALQRISFKSALEKYKLVDVYALWQSVFNQNLKQKTTKQNYITIPTDKLIGRLIVSKGKVIGDDVEQLIDRLVRHQFIYFRSDENGWGDLYINPPDMVFWEVTHPCGVGHGGGASVLSSMSFEQADKKYKLTTLYDLLKKVFDERL